MMNQHPLGTWRECQAEVATVGEAVRVRSDFCFVVSVKQNLVRRMSKIMSAEDESASSGNLACASGRGCGSERSSPCAE